MLGNLTWAAIPFNEPIPLVTSVVVMLGVLGVTTLAMTVARLTSMATNSR